VPPEANHIPRLQAHTWIGIDCGRAPRRWRQARRRIGSIAARVVQCRYASAGAATEAISTARGAVHKSDAASRYGVRGHAISKAIAGRAGTQHGKALGVAGGRKK